MAFLHTKCFLDAHEKRHNGFVTIRQHIYIYIKNSHAGHTELHFHSMSPVATNAEAHLEPSQLFNPFYSPSIGDDGDQTYPHAQFKVSLNAVS